MKINSVRTTLAALTAACTLGAALSIASKAPRSTRGRIADPIAFRQLRSHPASSETAGPPLQQPDRFQGIYLTCWSAGSEAFVGRILQLAEFGGINAVVIDLKDASGYVAYDTEVPEVSRYKTGRVTIRGLEALLERFHRAGLYVIGRLVVFQDPRLAAARPEWAVHSRRRIDGSEAGLSKETLWRDRKGLAWMDPAATPVWDYNLRIAREAILRGVDEVNFDYIRFPSDGRLDDMVFPRWDTSDSRRAVLRRFFAHIRKQLADAVVSADLFGLATVNRDDLGVGQILEDALPYFDYVCPMVYPSHYAPGFLGKDNPADHPFSVIHYSMSKARARLGDLRPEGSGLAKLRPWLQDFSLGAVYDATMVRKQIQAVKEALAQDYCGFLLWSPSNRYTREALEERTSDRGPTS